MSVKPKTSEGERKRSDGGRSGRLKTSGDGRRRQRGAGGRWRRMKNGGDGRENRRKRTNGDGLRKRDYDKRKKNGVGEKMLKDAR